MKKRQGFTLIEVLVTMAIIGLLVGLLVTNVDRSLSKNRVADDVNLFSSKIEQTRLLSGSTQQSAQAPGLQDDVDSSYYALYLPAGPAPQSSYGIVRLSSDLNNGSCNPSSVYVNGGYKPECLIEEVALSGGVNLINPVQIPRMVAFKTPTQQLTNIVSDASGWQAQVPTFDDPLFRLTFQDKTATVSIDNYTGKLTAVYQ